MKEKGKRRRKGKVVRLERIVRRGSRKVGR